MAEKIYLITILGAYILEYILLLFYLLLKNCQRMVQGTQTTKIQKTFLAFAYTLVISRLSIMPIIYSKIKALSEFIFVVSYLSNVNIYLIIVYYW